MAHRRRFRKGPCCKYCFVYHHKASAARAHHRLLKRKKPTGFARKKATGFAMMSVTKRRKIARKGGRASARARGY